MAATFARILGTEKDRSNCPFFYRIGACRHGDRCSRNHLRPHFSVTLMVPHMYQPSVQVPAVPTSESSAATARYFDAMPDADEFIDFWEDVLDEVERHGRVEDMLVLQNAGEHMHGNTYIKFHSEQEADSAKQRISGRYYHGRPLQPEYSPVTDFSEAVCGMFKHGFCERGDYCTQPSHTHATVHVAAAGTDLMQQTAFLLTLVLMCWLLCTVPVLWQATSCTRGRSLAI